MQGADKPIVTITGISGYLGAQTCLAFLKDGSYKVRGTVRSATNEAKIQPLRDGFGDFFNQLELVEADLLNEESMIKAMEGATYIVHTASPFVLQVPEDENELIKPAVDGTLAVMKGAHKNKVKRVVLTSTIGAVAYGGVGAEDPNNLRTHFTGEDWSNVDKCAPYAKSKTLAEKAAWDFVAALPEGEKFELAVINPGFIIGPALNKAQFASGDIIKMMMLRGMPALPNSCFGMIDVRDCARAHLRALQVPEAAGKRFLCVKETDYLLKVSQVLAEKYKGQYEPLDTLAPNDGSSPWWGVAVTYDNAPLREVLGIEFTELDQTITEMAESLINIGYIPDQRTKL